MLGSGAPTASAPCINYIFPAALIEMMGWDGLLLLLLLLLLLQGSAPGGSNPSRVRKGMMI